MKKMKKTYFLFLFLLLVSFFTLQKTSQPTYANNIVEINFVVYDEDGNYLFERINLVVGDIYIDKNFNKYVVYIVDEINHTGKAQFVETLPKPFVTKKALGGVGTVTEKKIALYLSHNDESYIIGDGTDSVYGAGGIHQVAKALQTSLERKNITTYLDETLHIPHDSLAYTRSRQTAQSLLKHDVNAIFDIHRDGASRSTYAKTTNGSEHSTIRIVVGQANANKDKNLQFALYLMSVAESVCPWLFLDIFYAKGHYNQDLFEKSLLFEMGTYTIEKNLVMETVPYLADVIHTTLFNTSVSEEGDLTIGLQTGEKTIDQALITNSNNQTNSFGLFTSAIAIIGLAGGCAFFVYKYRQKSAA